MVPDERKSLTIQSLEQSPESIFSNLLDQAAAMNRAQGVAEQLVNASIRLGFATAVAMATPPNAANICDFRIGDAALEVTTEKRARRFHLQKLHDLLRGSSLELWLLPRAEDCSRWQTAITPLFQDYADRIVLAGIEAFLGQFVTTRGQFRMDGVKAVFADLFALYERYRLQFPWSGAVPILDSGRTRGACK